MTLMNIWQYFHGKYLFFRGGFHPQVAEYTCNEYNKHFGYEKGKGTQWFECFPDGFDPNKDKEGTK